MAVDSYLRRGQSRGLAPLLRPTPANGYNAPGYACLVFSSDRPNKVSGISTLRFVSGEALNVWNRLKLTSLVLSPIGRLGPERLRENVYHRAYLETRTSSCC